MPDSFWRTLSIADRAPMPLMSTTPSRISPSNNEHGRAETKLPSSARFAAAGSAVGVGGSVGVKPGVVGCVDGGFVGSVSAMLGPDGVVGPVGPVVGVVGPVVGVVGPVVGVVGVAGVVGPRVGVVGSVVGVVGTV